jgi:hypothetical protein
MTGEFDTTASLARKANCSQMTIAGYADRGWLDFTRLPNGTRVLASGQEDKARKLLADGLARRGRVVNAKPSSAAA